MLNSLKSLSLSGDSWPDYIRPVWDTKDEENCDPPTTHFVSTVDDLTDMLYFDPNNIDGMDVDAGDDPAPPPMGRRTATSSYDVYMVDTPKEDNGDKSPRTKAKTTAQAPP